MLTHFVPLYCNTWLLPGAVIVASFILEMPSETAPVKVLTLVTGKAIVCAVTAVINPLPFTVICGTTVVEPKVPVFVFTVASVGLG